MKLDRKQWTYYGVLRGAEVILIALLLVMVYMISDQIKTVRREVAVESLNLEANLATAVEQGVLQSELERRNHDIGRLNAMVPERDNIDAVIEQMESAARNRELTIQIPSVANNALPGKAGETAKPVGKWQEVRMSVVVSGEETGVMEFWHEIENMVFLTGVVDFDLIADRSRQPSRNDAINPTLSAPEAEIKESRDGAKLTLEVLVSTKNSNESER